MPSSLASTVVVKSHVVGRHDGLKIQHLVYLSRVLLSFMYESDAEISRMN
jgi:hypothetical protein